jgi:antitoxin (DNA-binding transcriptional repressor) of toxin-antitoxin stability system
MTTRTHLHELTGEFAQAIKAMKAGKQVVLTQKGVPVAMLEPLRAASKEEERVILEMIESGQLQQTRKSGSVREWRAKGSRTRAA